MNHFYRSAVVWIFLLVIAFMNGAFREFVLKNALSMDAQAANQLSCLTGSLVMTGFVYLFWSKLKILTRTQAIQVGVGWLIATALFETFILNRKLTWPEILHTYDLSAGELWALVLLWIGILPMVIFSLKKPSESHSGRPRV